MKVIIAGGRDFFDFDLLCQKCDRIFANVEAVEVVSGGANGADKLGEDYAQSRGYRIKKFIPDWAELGKKAGPIRNRQMAEYADGLIAFWDGQSKGTANMIETANELGLLVRVVRY